MKRIIIVFLALFLVVPLFSQEYVNIPDANFLAALIEEGVDTDEDGKISYEEAEIVTGLDVSGNYRNSGNISDLTGIEAFVNIVALFCRYNQLTTLDVSKNTALTWLDCWDNQLTSLDVSGCTALSGLECRYNQLTTLDVSNNTALTKLWCPLNQLTTLDVSNNTALTYLGCGENQLTSLDVSGCTALSGLECSNNQLTTLDVSGCTALTSLECQSNQLTTLDVSNNTALVSLWCGANQLTSLDVSNNTALNYLHCGANQLTTLDVSSNTRLRELTLVDMPSLGQVCVWDSFPRGVFTVYTSVTGSPNVYFTTECSIGFDESIINEITAHPNPTNSTFTLDLETPILGELELHNLNGQLIYRRPIISTSEQIDMSYYPKGIYFVTVRSDAWVRTEKVVKY